MLRHSVIILYGEKTEVYRDVKTFVRAKGLAYQTWIQKNTQHIIMDLFLKRKKE